MTIIENIWTSISRENPFVHEHDLEVIEKYNQKYLSTQHQLRLDVIPEPYIGDPDAPVYLLNLNPGFSTDDVIWHKNQLFADILHRNLCHTNSDFPFYPLNPAIQEAPVCGWWLQKLKNLIASAGQETVSNRVFCVEYHGYHSLKYKSIPKRILKGHLPSQLYAEQLVRTAIQNKKIIILMRSRKEWFSLVPELEHYEYFFKIKNPQNPQISPNNLKNYENIVRAIKS